MKKRYYGVDYILYVAIKTTDYTNQVSLADTCQENLSDVVVN